MFRIPPLFACALLPFVVSGKIQPDWENPEVFSRDQTEPHAPITPYEDLQLALAGDPGASARVVSLNGDWSFYWASTPEEAPRDFHEAGADTSSWNSIRVPSNWQMEGFGHAKFRNIPLTFPSDPPFVPEYYNPIGLYRRTFEVPGSWAGQPVFLRFEGIKSASTVWINGREVGYNQGGMEPAEYSISEYITPGRNEIAVRVRRFSDGTYLENQDMWRLSGIYRDVTLYTVPSVYLRDYFVYTDFDAAYRDATLHLEAMVRNTSKVSQNMTLQIQLLDEAGKPVWESAFRKPLILAAGEEGTLNFAKLVDCPRQWSAEFPNLYTLTLELLDETGRVEQALAKRIGFRETEVGADGAILVNGQVIKFNGVNSHQHHPRMGRLVDEATTRRDFELMKQFNINLVRTAHYPPTVEYLELANEYGLYVVNETNDECHQNIYLSSDPAWRAQFVDRAEKMVMRDRNQTCIVFWSAGNETGRGPNMGAVIERGKALDPSRPFWMCGENEYSLVYEDIAGPRYWDPIDLKVMLNQPIKADARPVFMDEYLSVAGNALGGMDENWELIRRYPRHTGGAIWDWVSPSIDQALILARDASGNGLDGLVLGRAEVVSGKFGRGLSLSGNDEYIECYRSPQLDLTGPLTLEYWVRPGAFIHSGDFLLKSRHQYGLIQADAETLSFFVYDDEGDQRVSVDHPVPDNWVGQWHHLAGVYDETALKLYLNGELVGETPFAGQIRNTPFSLALGYDTEVMMEAYTGQTAVGVLDNVRVYDRAVPVSALGKAKPSATPVLDLDFERVEDTGEILQSTGGGRTYGLVWADRSVQPELWQVKKSPQPVSIEAIDLEAGVFEITNHHHFRNLDTLDATARYMEGGVLQKTIALSMEAAAGETIRIRVDPNDFQQVTEQDRWLEFQFTTREATIWAAAGHEVAWEQFLVDRAPSNREPNREGSLTVVQQGGEWIISGTGFRYTFGSVPGGLVRLETRSQVLLETGPEFGVWRAPLANDQDPWSTYRYAHLVREEGLGRGMDGHLRTSGIDKLTLQPDALFVETLGAGHIRVEIRETAYAEEGTGHNVKNSSAGFNLHYVYDIYGDGSFSLSGTATPERLVAGWLPRVGLSWTIPQSLGTVTWYGRGPFETYPDRKTGARVSVYSLPVKDFYVPYLIPQDHGNRTDTRWVEVSNPSGTGFRLSSDDPFHFSAHRYCRDNLDRALWPHQLKARDVFTLNTDFAVSGVGDTSALVMQPYRVPVAPVKFRVQVQILP